MKKSEIKPKDTYSIDRVGRSYVCFCLEQALVNVKQTRALLRDDVADENYELARVERLLTEALNVA